MRVSFFALVFLFWMMAAQGASFEERCSAAGVVLCDPLDSGRVSGAGIDADTPFADGLPIGNNWKSWRHSSVTSPWGTIFPAVMDSDIKASGTGSLKFTIPSESGPGTSGYFQTNFTPDNSVQFGEGDTFYVQWRQRFSYEMLFDDDGNRRKFDVTGGAGGFKTVIINSGDHEDLSSPVDSCTDQHLVFGNQRQWGAITGYHSCGRYINFAEKAGQVTGRLQLNYQPGSEVGGCFRLDPVTGLDMQVAGTDCVLFWPNEWMTFQVKVTIGTYAPLTSAEKSSNIKLWAAREGAASKLVMDHNLNLHAPEQPFMGYGKMWLTPYHTNKDKTQVHPEAYTWYDELIVSTAKIAPPDDVQISEPDPDPVSAIDPNPALVAALAQCNADYDILLGEFDALLIDYNALLATIDPPPAGDIPAHIANAPAGEWSAIGQNTLRDVAPDYSGYPPEFNDRNVNGVMTAWSGGVYAEPRCTLYVEGGGHNDYDGNEWYGFNLCTNRWDKVNDPSPYVWEDYPLGNPDGSPTTLHTYGILGYSPVTDLLYRLGRADAVYSVDPDTGAWSKLSYATPSDHNNSSVFWNPTLGEFWGIYKDQGSWGRAYSFDTITPFMQQPGAATTKAGAAGFSDERQEILYKTKEDQNDNYAVYDITAKQTAQLLTVNPPPISSAHGLAWDSVRNRWVAWNGGATLYYLVPGELTWTSETHGGVTPSAGQQWGTYGRFQYIPEFDVFIGVNSVDEPVFMFKP